MEVKWEKVVKYRYSRIRQNKPSTRHGKNNPIKKLPTPTKRNTDSFRGITEHCKSKTDRQNATPNEKHRPQCPENATERTKTKTAYKNTRPQKENATQGKKKAAHNLNRERRIIRISYVLLYFCIVDMFLNRLML